MHSFDLKQVKLTDPLWVNKQNLIREYLIQFDIDRLMHNFRVNAGIHSDAQPLGGWESPECAVRGHFVGHFLAACAKYAYGFEDEELKEKAYKIVDIMAECVFENGYLSAFDEKQLDILEEKEEQGVWAPYYTLHKILSGLVCCVSYLGNEKALVLAENLALYIYERFQKLSYWKIDNMLRCTKVNPVNEFGGIGDVLYSLWTLTKNEKILELAKVFDRDYFIRNLAEDRDILTDLHANTHLPMVIAAMHRYSLTGEEHYKEAALNFYKYVMPRTFANGNSSSRAEHFIKGGVSEASEHWGAKDLDLSYVTGGESESCCAHNMEILLEYFLEYDQENSAVYLEHLESLKYNAVFNSTSGVSGLSQYHQPLGKDKKKKFSSMYDDFWCCTASGVEAMTELQKNIWLKKGNKIVLNQFVASNLILERSKTWLELVTDYPESESAVLKIHTVEPKELCITMKTSSVKEISMEKEDCHTSVTKDEEFFMINGLFQDGDRILLEINSPIHRVFLGKEEHVYAFMYGKVLLAKIQGEISEEECLTKGEKDCFTGKNSKFIPLYKVEDEIYTVYLNSSNTNEAKDGSSAYDA